MNTKRILSFVLTLAILLGLIPSGAVSAFAADALPIDAVEVTIDHVALGSTTDTITLTLPADANYQVEIDGIRKAANDGPVPFSGTFEEGDYSIDLRFTPNDGYAFSYTDDEYVDYHIYGDNILVEIIEYQDDDCFILSVLYSFGTIDAVYANIGNASAGLTTKYVTAFVPSDAKYGASVVAINKVDGESRVPFSGTFAPGDTYEAILHFKARAGHTFADNLTSYSVGCNNEDHSTTSRCTITRRDPEFLELAVEFYVYTPIHEVDITVTGMEEGKSSTDVQVNLPADAIYTLDTIELLDANGDPFSGTFERDLYIAYIYLISGDERFFSKNMEVSINGIPQNIYHIGEEMMVEYHLDLRTPIDEVDISVSGMEQGKSAEELEITLPTGSNYTLDSFMLVNAANQQPFFGTFENELYNLYIYLLPNEGCFFSDEMAATVNGIPHDCGYLDEDILIEYSLDLRTPIDKVDITVSGMEQGKTTADVKVTLPSGVNYTLYDFFILDKDWQRYEGPFEIDRYLGDIYLEAANGYYFPKDAEITLNGAPADTYYFYDNGATLNVEYHLDTRPVIEHVEITITGAEKGTPVANVAFTMPDGASYVLDRFDLYDSAWNEFSGTLGADLYTFDIYLQTTQSGCFADDVTVTINSEQPYYSNIYQSGSALNLLFDLDLRTPVSQVDLPAWPSAPKAGDAVPDSSMFGPLGYTYTPFWATQDGACVSGDRFASNTVYYYVLDVRADYGFVFTEDVTVIVGDEVYTGLPIQNGRLLVAKTYPIGINKLVDQINLSAATPVSGKLPGEVTASGTGYTLEEAYWLVADNGNGSGLTLADSFQAGNYAYLAFRVKAAAGYTLDLNGQVLFNGKAYPILPEFVNIYEDGTVEALICLGQVRDGILGDFTGDGKVTDADVIYLLWHTVFPEDYPIEGQADFTGDNKVTDADVIYLLWHTVFPEDYPLS